MTECGLPSRKVYIHSTLSLYLKKEMAKDCKRLRMGKDAVKLYLLEMTGVLL